MESGFKAALVDSKGKLLEIPHGKRLTLGRSKKATLRLLGSELSRLHASLELVAEGLVVTDLGSSNGTYVEGQLVASQTPTVLKNGQRLQLGEHVFIARVSTSGETKKKGPRAPSSEIELLTSIGSGAAGSVWMARQLLLDRIVAVKALDADVDPQSAAYKRFLREAKVCSRIKSPYVVELYDIRIFDGVPCLIMEFVNGLSLGERLEASEMELGEILKIAEELSWALHATHEQGVIHRDVKPDNVLLDPEGGAKLTDFGIAKELEGDGANITLGGSSPGSIPYCAPEQLTNLEIDARADIYGLGSTLYHAIAGKPPFMESLSGPGLNLTAMVGRIRGESPQPLGELRAECPSELADLVQQLMAKDPEKRPSSPRTLAETFSAIRKTHTLGQADPGPEESAATADPSPEDQATGPWELGPT